MKNEISTVGGIAEAVSFERWFQLLHGEMRKIDLAPLCFWLGAMRPQIRSLVDTLHNIAVISI